MAEIFDSFASVLSSCALFHVGSFFAFKLFCFCFKALSSLSRLFIFFWVLFSSSFLSFKAVCCRIMHINGLDIQSRFPLGPCPKRPPIVVPSLRFIEFMKLGTSFSFSSFFSLSPSSPGNVADCNISNRKKKAKFTIRPF